MSLYLLLLSTNFYKTLLSKVENYSGEMKRLNKRNKTIKQKWNSAVSKWWVRLIIAFIVALICVFVTHILLFFTAPVKWLEAKWNPGELLTFIGTITLSYVAIEQNRKANDIANKALELNKTISEIEIERDFPFIDLRPITYTEFKKHNKNHILSVSLDNCYCLLDDNMDIQDSDGDVFIFELKNVRENDILDIKVHAVEIGVSKNKEDIVQGYDNYSAETSLRDNTLRNFERIPLVLTIPDKWFSEVDKCYNQSSDTEDDFSLYVSIYFVLMSNSGAYYTQNIELNVVNSAPGDICLPIIVKKFINKPKKTKQEF